MDCLKKLVGKADKDTFDWLPLSAHIQDIAGVMECLVKEWVSDTVVSGCGLEYGEFLKIAQFVAAVHDIGKATSCFQNKITLNAPVLRDELTSSGLKIRDTIHYRETPHAFAGYWILQSMDINESVANIIGAHHGRPLSVSLLNGEPDLLKLYPANFYGEEGDCVQKQLWESMWKKIVEEGLKKSGFCTVSDLPVLTVNAQVLLSGLLIVADWIASNVSLFPLMGFFDSLEKLEYPERVYCGWEKLHFPECWESKIYWMNEQIFRERFNVDNPRDVQRAMYNAVNDIKEPGIVVLEAQMGVGKTEAALSAVEVLAAKCHSRGVFFGLPTQATSNAIYKRLYTWANNISEGVRNAIELAHGGAIYNEEYQVQLLQGKALVDNVDETTDSDSGVFVHPWFQGNKKALLSDFVIGTVDQFLMAALKRKHFMLRHLGLAGKIVVIDECHAYDAYMNRYLDKALEWMAGYEVPVILLSATLPVKRREELIQSYLRGRKKPSGRQKKSVTLEKDSGWKQATGYPMLTWTDGDHIYQRKIHQNVENREIQIMHLADSDNMVAVLQEKLQDGGCACVIANTVKNAQRYYHAITERLSDAEVILYHAGFTMEDRVKKEKQILSRLGKDSENNDRNHLVLIGTQVLEQSLDYDVDLMMTEPCPMDLFLQRIGRLHRHPRNDERNGYSRPERLEIPECYIIHDKDNKYDRGSVAVYGEYLLMRTLGIMPEKINIPEDIPKYVQRVYCKEDACGLNLQDDAYVKAKNEFFLRDEKKRQNGEIFLLKKPRDKKGINGILDNEYSGSENQESMGVRDIDPTIEVILMKQKDEYTAAYINTGKEKSESVDMTRTPNAKDSLDIARQRIHLPRMLSTEWMWRKVISNLENRQKKLVSWQMSPWLRGELILLLDTNQSVELCGYQLHYDFKTGLEYEGEEARERG